MQLVVANPVSRRCSLLTSIAAAFVAVLTVPPARAAEGGGVLTAGRELTRLCEGTATAEQLSCVSFLGGVYSATITLGQLVGPRSCARITTSPAPSCWLRFAPTPAAIRRVRTILLRCWP